MEKVKKHRYLSIINKLCKGAQLHRNIYKVNNNGKMIKLRARLLL
jgi:hypothetical protein